MKVPNEMIRSMALCERLMDEGKIPFVMAPSPNGKMERLAVAPDIMEELGLEQGQTVNSIIFDAIAELSMNRLLEMVEKGRQESEDGKLDENFDFRTMLGEDGTEPTKH